MRILTVALTCLLALVASTAEAGRLFAVPTDGSDRIVELDPADGSELNSFPAPESPDLFCGLAYDGASLYFLQNTGADTLYQLDPDTGAPQTSWPLGFGSGSFDGLAVLNGLVHIQDSSLDLLHVFDPVAGVPTGVVDPSVGLIGGAGALAGPDALLASNGSFVYAIDPNTWTSTLIANTDPLAALGVASVDGQVWVSGFDVLDNSNRAEVYLRDGTFVRSVDLPYQVGALAGFAEATTPPGPAIPEPASLSLLALGALALRRRRK